MCSHFPCNHDYGRKIQYPPGEPTKIPPRKIIFKSSFLGGDMLVPRRVMTICVFMCMRVLNLPNHEFKLDISLVNTRFYGATKMYCWKLVDFSREKKKHHELQGSHNITSPNNALLRGSSFKTRMDLQCLIPKTGVIARLIPPYPKLTHSRGENA